MACAAVVFAILTGLDKDRGPAGLTPLVLHILKFVSHMMITLGQASLASLLSGCWRTIEAAFAARCSARPTPHQIAVHINAR
jgi:hypothetical protein